MNTKIVTLSLNAHQPDDDLSLYTSKNDRNQKHLVVLAEILKAQEQHKKIVKTITNELEDSFLNSQISETEKTLEDALQKVNFSISELIKHTKKEWLLSSHVIIAGINLSNAEISFAKIGKTVAYLAQQKNITPITEENPDGDINPVKPFANLYSGTLPENAAMLFLTENILNYVSLEKIRSLAVDLPAIEFRDALEELLKKAPKSNPFGAFIIKNESSTLGTAEKTTSQKLHIQTVSKKTHSINGQKERSMEIEHEKELDQPFPVQSNRHTGSLIRPKLLKIITISIIVVVSVLVFNFFNKPDTAPLPFRAEPTPPTDPDLLAEVNAKFIQAQSYLVLDQKDQAALLLAEIQETLKTAPVDTDAKKQQRESFERKVATQFLLIDGVSLTKGKVHTDFLDITPASLILKEGTVYSFNAIDSSVYRAPQAGGAAPLKIQITADKVGSMEKILDHTGEGILFYDSSDGLMRLHLEKSILAPIVWERTWKGAPKAADIYQNKLYVITGDAKLLKYTRSITGYTQEGNWLASEVPAQLLAGTVSMAIDGTVWVLKENGEIIKLFKGKQVPFAYTIEPPLKKPVKIFTDLYLAYLYLLDTQTRRVVILNKEGKLINQLTAEELSVPSDMAVDEKSKKIYLLDGSKIFEIGF